MGSHVARGLSLTPFAAPPALICFKAPSLEDAFTGVKQGSAVMTKVLVVFYSETGNTRGAAEAVARRLNAELEAIEVEGLRSGLLGYGQRIWWALRGRPAAIAATKQDPADFDLVVLCSPVWAGHVSPPLRGYLLQAAGHLPAVALLVTSGGSNPGSAFTDMAALAGKTPVAELDISDRERRRGEDTTKLGAFIDKLEAEVRARSAA